MWSYQAKAITWVYLIFFCPFFLTVYILNNVFCKFQVISTKMISESLISRYVVQNTTFDISPFKVSSLIPWYNTCTMYMYNENTKKIAEKMPPMLQIFLRWQIKGEWWRKKQKNEIDFFSPHYLNRPVSQNRKYTQVVAFAWNVHIWYSQMTVTRGVS